MHPCTDTSWASGGQLLRYLGSIIGHRCNGLCTPVPTVYACSQPCGQSNSSRQQRRRRRTGEAATDALRRRSGAAAAASAAAAACCVAASAASASAAAAALGAGHAAGGVGRKADSRGAAGRRVGQCLRLRRGNFIETGAMNRNLGT